MKTYSLASRMFERSAVYENISGAKYERHVNFESMDDSSSTGSQPISENATPDSKGHRKMHFALLPEKYKPLMGHDDELEKKKRKKEKYKKVRKNVRKTLKCTWKCLVLGLYNFALGYCTPMSVATTFTPDFHQRPKP